MKVYDNNFCYGSLTSQLWIKGTYPPRALSAIDDSLVYLTGLNLCTITFFRGQSIIIFDKNERSRFVDYQKKKNGQVVLPNGDGFCI